MNPEDYQNYQMQEAIQDSSNNIEQSKFAPQVYEQFQEQQGILVNQTNPKETVQEILQRFRGIMTLPDGSTQRISAPVMNEQGVSHIWVILDSWVNNNVRLTHLSEEEISSLMRQLSKDLVKLIASNWRRYGITNKQSMNFIVSSVLGSIFCTLKRAQEQNEKNWLGKISFENLSGGSRLPPNKKEGFLSKFRL